jgi:[ribosomal protein S5]-alanine N-acetyltransferase
MLPPSSTAFRRTVFDRKRAAKLLRNLPQLTTSRLLLRKFKRTDVHDVFAYASDPEVALYTVWEQHRDLKTTRQFVSTVLKAYRQGHPAPWAIVLRKTGKLIGAIVLRNWSFAHSRAEVGYVLSREYWGKGYVTEALNAVLAFGFSEMELHRIEAKAVPENRGSTRVMEKAGMKCEGLLRDYEFVKGAYHSLNLYSILKNDFDTR